MYGAISDCLDTQSPKRNGPLDGQQGSCQRRGELAPAQPVIPKSGALLSNEAAGNFIRRGQVDPMISTSSAGLLFLSHSWPNRIRSWLAADVTTMTPIRKAYGFTGERTIGLPSSSGRWDVAELHFRKAARNQVCPERRPRDALAEIVAVSGLPDLHVINCDVQAAMMHDGARGRRRVLACPF